MYQIIIKKKAKKFIDKLPMNERKRIAYAIEQLPNGEESLSARLKTGKFSKVEYEQMAEILGVKFLFRFEFSDSTRI